MSYDLTFCAPAGRAVPSAVEIEAYFAERPRYQAGNGQFFYANEDTGVYFSFELGGADEEAHDDDEEWAAHRAALARSLAERGQQPVALSFNINYARPSVFGLEAAHELDAVVQRFSLSVEDPQVDGMDTGVYSTDGFLAGWNAGNVMACRALAGHAQSGAAGVPTLPRAELERHWRWNRGRASLERELRDEVFVPRISYLNPDGKVRSCVVWTDAIPVALPEVDVVLLARVELAPRRLLLFRQAPSLAAATWSELRPVLETAEAVATPEPHHLLRRQPPPAGLLRLFSDRPPVDLKGKGVSVDTIFDAELVREAGGAPPS